MAVPITAAMQNAIAQNYIAILGRNPDPSGFAFWVQTYADANATPAALTAITNGFGNSVEFRETYAGKDTSTAIGLMYQNVLLRAADAGGLAYWTNYANNLISSGLPSGLPAKACACGGMPPKGLDRSRLSCMALVH